MKNWKKIKIEDVRAGDIIRLANDYCEVIGFAWVSGESFNPNDASTNRFVTIQIGDGEDKTFFDYEVEAIKKLELIEIEQEGA